MEKQDKLYLESLKEYEKAQINLMEGILIEINSLGGTIFIFNN